ncbi:MAG: TolC family protein [Fimbriimonadales bacterium]
MKQLSFLLIAMCATANAQISQVQKDALEKHPAIAAAQAGANALAAQGRQEKAPYKPMVSLTGIAAKGDDNMIFGTNIEPRSYIMAAGDPVGIGAVMAMWTIYSGGRDRSAAAYAGALMAEGAAMVETARLEVLRDVRVAYAESMAARERHEATFVGLQSAEELLRITDQMFQAGSAPEAFVLRARAGLERARRARALSEADIRSALAVLEEAAFNDLEDVRLEDWDLDLLAPATVEEALKLAEARPEMKLVEARRLAALARARKARQSAYPELNLVGYGQGVTTKEETDAFYKIGVVLSVPLVDGGMRKAQADEMSAMATQAQQQKTLVWMRISREIASAWAQWQAAPEVVRSSQAEVTSAHEAYRIARLRYQEGKAPQVEVDQSAADLVAAISANADANAFQRIAWANLMRAVGNQLK